MQHIGEICRFGLKTNGLVICNYSCQLTSGRLSIDDLNIAVEERAVEVIAIDEALKKLHDLDPLQARVVELRFFGGLSVEETAQILELSEATIKRYTNSARAWLHLEINKGARAAAAGAGQTE